MGDRLGQAGISHQYVTKPTWSTQPKIPLGWLNRVPALTAGGKSGNVTSARWQVTLSDPIRHVSSRSSKNCCTPFTLLLHHYHVNNSKLQRGNKNNFSIYPMTDGSLAERLK